MNFHLSLSTFLILLFSCSGIEKSNITFAGKIKNNNESIVKVSNYKSSLSEEIQIDSYGNFNGSFLIDKEGYYYFQIGRSYTTVFFSYYPHLGTSTGRYKDTRFWSHWIPRFLNHSMQLHFIHHLHPSIGHYDEPKAIEALKPFLVAREVPGADQIPDRVTLNPLINI